jgi:DNA (cytosine-5)-methyltransferase 1
VFVVGYLGDWRAAAAVLFERHSLSGDSAPSREKRKEAASGITHGLGDGGELARCLNACNTASGRMDVSVETFVSQPIALQDITSREKAQNGKGWNADGSAYTVDTHATQGVAQPIPFDTTQITSKANYSKPESGDPCHPLAAGAHPPAIAQPISFSGQMSYPQTDVGMTQTLQAKNPMAVAVPEVMCTLRASGAGFDRPGNSATEHETYIPVGAFKPGQSAQAHSIGYENEMAPTLEAGSGGNNKPAVHHGMAVRRLTPVECERLQGFGDNYTNIKDKCPDGPRYKALGNSMAVPVMAWIGKRIQEVEQMQCKPNK